MAELQGVKRVIEVAVDGSKAIASLKEIAKSTKELDDKLGEFGETLKKTAETLGIAFGAHEIVESVKGIVESFDQIGKDAQKVGIAADELQRLRYSAQYSGVSTETLQKAMAKLASEISNVGPGTTEVAKRLQSLGITAGTTTREALDKIADRFKSLPDSARKTADAMAIFGKGMSDLVPWLNQGAEGIRETADRLDTFGKVADDRTIAMASKFADNLQDIATQSKAAGHELVTGLLPGLIAVSGALIDARKQSDLFRTAGEAIGSTFEGVAEGLIRFAGQAKAIGIVFKGVWEEVTGTDDAWQTMQDNLRKNSNETIRSVIKLEEAQRNAAREAEAEAARRKKDAAERQAALDRELAQEKKAREEEEARRKAAEAARLATQQAAEAARKAKELQAATDKAASDAIKGVIEDEKYLEERRKQAADDEAIRARTNEQDAYTIAVRDTTKAFDDYVAANLKYQAEQQALIEMTKTGTEEQKKWAGQLLHNMQLLQHMAPIVDEEWKKMATSMDDAWGRFLESVSSGTVSVAQAFSAMVRSIIADLLKIYARKYIVDMLVSIWGGGTSTTTTTTTTSGGGGWGGGTIPSAFGNAFAGGRTVPFASGGIVGSPVRVPMALMGEAGPEAILPLQRTGSGALGVAAARPALNVAIHNHTDASVRASRGRGGDLQVVIEATKRAMAADFRRGGNDLSRAAEAAWGLNRGSGAPY